MESACAAACTTLPDEMPVMFLADCHLFPGCLLPLFIFEERYRLMLAHTLGAQRMFCICNREADDEDAPAREFTTAGLVRACVKQCDGTSQLLLQGITRIRIKRWVQLEPFPIAEIERVQTIVGDALLIAPLKARALELFAHSGKEEHAQKLCEFLTLHDNDELVCDVLSYHFTRCPKLQRKLLEEVSLEARYEMMIAAMEKHGGK